MAWTAGTGRSHFGHRIGLVFRGVEDLQAKLEEVASAEALSYGKTGKNAAFLFLGEGSQRIGMGLQLYETEPVVRAVLDRCDELVRELRGESLLDVMFGRIEEGRGLDDPAWLTPALYALECAHAALWSSVGVRPTAVLGHGVVRTGGGAFGGSVEYG